MKKDGFVYLPFQNADISGLSPWPKCHRGVIVPGELVLPTPHSFCSFAWHPGQSSRIVAAGCYNQLPGCISEGAALPASEKGVWGILQPQETWEGPTKSNGKPRRPSAELDPSLSRFCPWLDSDVTPRTPRDKEILFTLPL